MARQSGEPPRGLAPPPLRAAALLIIEGDRRLRAIRRALAGTVRGDGVQGSFSGDFAEVKLMSELASPSKVRFEYSSSKVKRFAL